MKHHHQQHPLHSTAATSASSGSPATAVVGNVVTSILVIIFYMDALLLFRTSASSRGNRQPYFISTKEDEESETENENDDEEDEDEDLMAIATVRTTHAAANLISSISSINVGASAEIYDAFVLVGAAHPLVAQTVFDERFDKHRSL